jgi:muramidase (phage lysozyme)
MIALIPVALAVAAVFVISRSGGNGVDTAEPAGADSMYQQPPAPNANPPGGGLPGDPQVAAFLALIRQSEGTAQYPDPWGTYYGGAQFSDKSCHPCEVRADGSRVLDPVRLASGSYTTAAGAYQITLTTWNRYGGTPHYGDFGNAAQDQCAADIIAACGGSAQIASGDISGAQSKLASQWASFTPANLASNLAAFQAAGGSLTS